MTRFCHLSMLVLTVLGVAACGRRQPPPVPPAAAAVPARDQLNRIVERYWDEYPSAGETRANGPAKVPIAPQFLADSLAFQRRYLAELRAVTRASLGTDARVTYDIFKRELELSIEGFTYPRELLPLNPFEGMPWQLLQGAGGVSTAVLATPKDYDEWLRRLGGYAAWTSQAILNMRDGLRRGYTLPRMLVEQELPLLDALGRDTQTNAVRQSLNSIPASFSAADRERISAALQSTLEKEILPATRRLHDFLQNEYLPRARGSIGLSALPLGEAWYAYLVKDSTSANLPPADIHALGLAEVERIRGRMQTLLAEGPFAGNVAAFWDAARHEPRFAYGTADELLSAVRDLKTQAGTASAELFAAAPVADFDVLGSDAQTFPGAPALWYRPAAPYRKTSAVLYVNTAGLATRPGTILAPGLLRESVPGRHYQDALQQERGDLPRIRRFDSSPAFVEGWALYAEMLGEELGLYRDAQTRFAALWDQMSCATDLVLDTGLHSMSWSRAQALEYLHGKLPIDELAAVVRVDRMIALPAAALACEMGELKMQALRARAQQLLGTRFDIRAFHTEILKDGAMPLDILDAKIQVWAQGVP